MKNKEQMETALKRHEIIAPLLMQRLEEAQKRRLRYEILEQEKISERTLRRYIKAYKEASCEGLKPKVRSDQGKPKLLIEKF